MLDPKKNLDELPIGALMAIVGRLHATRTDQALERMGLYRGQAFLLMILSRQDGLTHSEVAEKLEISPAAATKVIKRMEALRYLRRSPDADDERISRVFLEADGWALIQQIRKTFAQVDEVLLSNLNDEEQKTLVRLLKQVYVNLFNQEPAAAV